MPSSRSSVSAAPAVVAILLLAAAPAARAQSPRGEKAPDDLVLAIPESAVQQLLDRATPLEGRTPQGLRYTITHPRVSIRGGKILATMAITMTGGVSVLSVSLAGTVDAEIVARVDPRTRSIRGGLQIRRLAIDGLEDLSDADDVKAFLNDNLTRFDYPLDLPSTVVPELSILLSGEITQLEVAEGKVLLHARLSASHDNRRAER